MEAYNLSRKALQGFIRAHAQARRDAQQTHNPSLRRAAAAAQRTMRQRISVELANGARHRIA